MSDLLPNGLVVIVEERRSAGTVAVHLAARAGARDDGALPGITTLTSRTMFQGTARRPAESALERVAAQVGGSITRSGAAEVSTLASVVPAREVDLAFDLLADVVRSPLFDRAALARQQQITLQEVAERRSDPSILLGDLFQASMFAGHPVRTPVLGTPDSIEAVTRDALIAHYERCWGAANLVLAVVGRLPAADALAKAQQYFGDLPAGAANQRAPVAMQARTAGETVRGEAGRQQVQFRLGFPAPGLLDQDRYPLEVLNALTSGLTGPFGRELRTVRGIAYVAGSNYITYTDAGAWYATAGVDPQNLDAALGVVRTEIQGLRDAPLPASIVAGNISYLTGRQSLLDETNAARASRLASQQALGAEPAAEFMRHIRQVTPAQVQDVARRYLDPQRALVVIAGPSAG
jgi:zinc protease